MEHHHLLEGQRVAVVVGIEEKCGKLGEIMSRKKVVMTLNNGLEDMSVLKEFGLCRLQRKIDSIFKKLGVRRSDLLVFPLAADPVRKKRDFSSQKCYFLFPILHPLSFHSL